MGRMMRPNVHIRRLHQLGGDIFVILAHQDDENTAAETEPRDTEQNQGPDGIGDARLAVHRLQQAEDVKKLEVGKQRNGNGLAGNQQGAHHQHKQQTAAPEPVPRQPIAHHGRAESGADRQHQREIEGGPQGGEKLAGSEDVFVIVQAGMAWDEGHRRII